MMVMDHAEFKSAILRLFGSEAEAARRLGINQRTMRKYTADPARVSATNALRVPASLAAEVSGLLARFPSGVPGEVDPRQTIEILHRHMIEAGWTEAEAAAGILGAAMSQARDVLGDDGVSALTRA